MPKSTVFNQRSRPGKKLYKLFLKQGSELRLQETPNRSDRDLNTPVYKSAKRSCMCLVHWKRQIPVNSEKTIIQPLRRSIDNPVQWTIETIGTELSTTISEIVDAETNDLRNKLKGKVTLKAANLVFLKLSS